APTASFAQGETFEFAKNDPAAAIDAFREISKSPDAATRAGAWMRLGRNLAKTGRTAEALDIYSKLARTDGEAINGVPGDLIGRYAGCELLQRLNRPDELRSEAAQLLRDLDNGRWVLTAPVYGLYSRDAIAWSGNPARNRQEAEAFSEVLNELWTLRR